MTIFLRRALISGILYLTSVQFVETLGVTFPTFMTIPVYWTGALRSFNSYGLFAVMTDRRHEIVMEGSRDGKEWKEYEFKYKPGNLARSLPQIAPFQPRLDWQMWFAVLSDYQRQPWLFNFCLRLLQGSDRAQGLLAVNPFPEEPPLMIRLSVYEYRFTSPEERQQTGHWWVRHFKGLYSPIVSLRHNA